MRPALPPAGVGITFKQLASGGFAVVKVGSGGPSDQRGVQPGDILVFVDGIEVNERSFEHLARLLSGPIGSVVSLTFARKSPRKPNGDSYDLDLQYTIDVNRGPAQISLDSMSATSMSMVSSPQLSHNGHSHDANVEEQRKSMGAADGEEKRVRVVLKRRTDPLGSGWGDGDAGGIGVIISNIHAPHPFAAYHVIVRIESDGAAAEAGTIHVGDVIESVDGQDMWGKSLSETTEALCGAVGSMVDLGLVRHSVHGNSMVSNDHCIQQELEAFRERKNTGHLPKTSAGSLNPAVSISHSQAGHGSPCKRSSTDRKERQEPRRIVLSTMDHEQLVRRVRVAHVHRLGGFTGADGALLWVVHALIATAMILFLVQTGMLPFDWDLTPFFDESRSLGAEVVAGGFFFPLAPIGLVSVIFMLIIPAFGFAVWRMGVTKASLIFSQRPGLLSVLVFGNVFSTGTLVLLYFDLSRLQCCDFVHELKYASLIIMAPATLGVLLFWAWVVIVKVLNWRDPITRRMHSEYFPVQSICMLVALSVLFLAAELMIFLKVEGYLVEIDWMTACAPAHAFFAVIFASSLASLCLKNPWIAPVSCMVSAIVGIFDSLCLEGILVLVLLRLDTPTIHYWEYALLTLALGPPVVMTLILIVDILFMFKDSQSASKTVTWLQPTVLEFFQCSDKIAAKVCWASPGSWEQSREHLEFRVEISEEGFAKTTSESGADLGVPTPIMYSLDKVPQWKEVRRTRDSFATLEHLEPARRYLVRVLRIPQDDRFVSGIPALIETPNWPTRSLEEILSTNGHASESAIERMSPTASPNVLTAVAGVAMVLKERRVNESDKILVVKHLVPGGPAMSSCMIEIGDYLVAVDGRRVFSSAQATSLILGERGSRITLTLERAGKRFIVPMRRGISGSSDAMEIQTPLPAPASPVSSLSVRCSPDAVVQNASGAHSVNLSQARASRIPKSIPGPLFLRELKASKGGSENPLYAVFDWVQQTHFDANILDLKLIEAGDNSDPHDYVMVFAGAENQVKVHNIMPGSSYRVRLRAGDFVDGELSTVVERGTLPFRTPSWRQVHDSWSGGDSDPDFASSAKPQQQPVVMSTIPLRPLLREEPAPGMSIPGPTRVVGSRGLPKGGPTSYKHFANSLAGPI